MNTLETEVVINKYTKSVNIDFEGMSDEQINSMLKLFEKMIKLMKKTK